VSARQVLLYFAWSRAAESSARLTAIDDRFPAIFELRRLFYPKFGDLADPLQVDQGITGFLDHVQKPNFAAFVEQASAQSSRPVVQVERVADDGRVTPLDAALIADVDTILVISFDSLATGQAASPAEVAAVRQFLAHPGHLLAVCPHHDIGSSTEPTEMATRARRIAEHLHHGDRAIPPRQAFGGFARSLLAGLGVPVENRFGLRPAVEANGNPAAIECDRFRDRWGLLNGVTTFNAHPHLPQLERVGASIGRLDVLVRQRIDLDAPPHPFTQSGRQTFDALLQSRPELFPGTLLVGDTTLWSSTAGGHESLQKLWSNILRRHRE